MFKKLRYAGKKLAIIALALLMLVSVLPSALPSARAALEENQSVLSAGDAVKTDDKAVSFGELDRYDDEGNVLAYTIEVEEIADYDVVTTAPVTDSNGNIDIDITATGTFTYGALTISNTVTGTSDVAAVVVMQIAILALILCLFCVKKLRENGETKTV